MFQSSRVARHQDASKAPNLVSSLRSSARSYLDTCKQRMLRPGSEVADMETLVGPAGRYVEPVFQHSGRHYVGFVRDLVKAGCVGFVETAVAHVGLFFFAMSNFRELLMTLRTGLWVRPILRTRFIKCASLDVYRRFLHSPLSSHPKTVNQKTSCSQIIDLSCPCNTSCGFLLGDVFLSRYHGPLHAFGKC